MKLIEHRYGEPIDQLLSRLYTHEGKTITEIGDIFGISESAVFRWLERCGIPTRNRGEQAGARDVDEDSAPVPAAR